MSQSEPLSPAIIFDFGGVLIDWNPHYLYRSFFDNDDEAVARFLNEIGFVEWNVEQDRGRPFAVAVAELSKRFPRHAHLISAYNERWEESIGGAIQPTVNILGALKQRGYALYGLSNWAAETFYRIRSRFPFLDWLNAIVLSGEEQMIKPDPRIYAVMLDRIGRPASECLFIDDSEANITVAKQLGFNTIHFTSSEQLANELIARGLLPQGWQADESHSTADTENSAS
jgi:2-haloacid dehalogenase